MLRLLNRISAG